jgi:hypothetical protein
MSRFRLKTGFPEPTGEFFLSALLEFASNLFTPRGSVKLGADVSETDHSLP